MTSGLCASFCCCDQVANSTKYYCESATLRTLDQSTGLSARAILRTPYGVLHPPIQAHPRFARYIALRNWRGPELLVDHLVTPIARQKEIGNSIFASHFHSCLCVYRWCIEYPLPRSPRPRILAGFCGRHWTISPWCASKCSPFDACS